MKILAFTDLHGNKKITERLIKKAKDVDLLVCAGDISIFERNLKTIISQFSKTKKPLIIIPGNHESPEALEKTRHELVIPLHKKIYKINNITFIGYGTDGFSARDKEFESFITKAKKEITEKERVIFITHGPPYGNKLDKLPYFGHVGNKSYNNAILQIKPFLHICGHLHENFGKKDKLGKTFLVNPGPEGKIINI